MPEVSAVLAIGMPTSCASFSRKEGVEIANEMRSSANLRGFHLWRLCWDYKNVTLSFCLCTFAPLREKYLFPQVSLRKITGILRKIRASERVSLVEPKICRNNSKGNRKCTRPDSTGTNSFRRGRPIALWLWPL